ncbi:MAG TPA: GtrA family protein [Acidimicrobiales bacterium]|nr:GtrA family protein [Acidimicrobiales bacterium]
MPSLVERARSFAKQPKVVRLWKYAGVSVISTVLTNVLLFLFYHTFSIASAMVCNVLATSITTVPAYYLNRTWTWGKSGKSHVWREVVPFWTIAAISLVLSTLAVGVAAHNADHLTHSKLYTALLVDFANLATYGFIWIFKFVLYNKYLFVHDSSAGKEDEAGASIAASVDATAPGLLAEPVVGTAESASILH